MGTNNLVFIEEFRRSREALVEESRWREVMTVDNPTAGLQAYACPVEGTLEFVVSNDEGEAISVHLSRIDVSNLERALQALRESSSQQGEG